MALLTTSATARLLGVGPTTIKRWVAEGRLRCITTPGGHRRFDRAEIEGLRPDPGGQLDDFAVRCLEKMVYDGTGSYGLEATLIEMRGHLGSWLQVADVMGTVLTELGRRWEQGVCSVAQEHAGTHRLEEAIRACAATLPTPPAAPRTVLAAVEGESHTLGLSLLDLCMREAGRATEWLGSPTPTSILVEAIERLNPNMVAVSASACSRDAGMLLRHYRSIGRACRRCGAVLVLGGQGAWPPKPSYGHRFRNFAELASLLTVSAEATERS